VTGSAARTVEYFVLLVCERFRLRPDEFERLDYDEQVRLLAFDQLRREEGLEFTH
jgi:hypothetical protein